MIEREFAAIDTRLAAIDARLSDIEDYQRESHEALSRQQHAGLSTLMANTIEQVDRLVRERPPPLLIKEASPAAAASGNKEQAGDTSRAAAPRIGDKQLVGSIEQVHLSPPGIRLEARIDTGAESSSLDARDMTEFKRDGNTWVRFRIMDADNEKSIEIERRVLRHVRILNSSTSDSERRPVVRLRLAIGSHSQVAEFTLSDREHLTYPVLIGRNVLTDVMIVDVSRTHIARLDLGQADSEPPAER